MRDRGACVFLGSADPEACHILPFAINSTNANRQELLGYRGGLAIGTDDTTKLSNLLVSSLGCSDKAWNMLLLNRQMHKWWSGCHFAIKCLGITPLGEEQSEIQLQFHWMPRTQQQALGKDELRAKRKGKAKPQAHEWERQIDLANGQGRDFVDSWKEKEYNGIPKVFSMDGVVSCADAISSRQLHSGRVIEISMDTKDAHKMKSMIDLQWATIQIAVLAGAAGSPDFLTDPFPEDEDDALWEAWWTGEEIDLPEASSG